MDMANSQMTPTSAVEFLLWLLIAAAIIAMLAKLLRIPYTVCLVCGGLLLGAVQLPLLSPLQPGRLFYPGAGAHAQAAFENPSAGGYMTKTFRQATY